MSPRGNSGVWVLCCLLFYSIAVLWVPERWAWGLFQLSIFGVTGACLSTALLHRTTLILNWALLPLGAPIVWGSLQLIASRTIYRWNTWIAMLDWATYLGTAFIALQLLRDTRKVEHFLRTVAHFSLVLAAVSIMQMFTSHGKVYWLFATGYTDFVLGPFLSRNQHAAFMELLLPIVLWCAIEDRRRAMLYAVTAGVIFASVIAGASRAGSILVAIEVVVFLALALANRYISPAEAGSAFGKLVVLLAFFTTVVGWQVLWNRLQQPDPFAVRREILWSSLDMVRARPIWGFGLGNWQTAYPQYAHFDDGSYVNQAHDEWVQWAAEGGIPLVLILASLGAICVRPAIRVLWGLGVLSVFVHAFVDYPLEQRPALAAWFFALVVLVVQAERLRRPAVVP
jgi:hypothetical protein